MAAQDFDTYTEVDPSGDFSIVDTLITVTSLQMDVSSYIYRDFGVDYFDGDVQCYFKIHIPSGMGVGSKCYVGALTNDLDDLNSIDTATGDFVALQIENNGGTLEIAAVECNASVLAVDATPADITIWDDTDLYCLILRDEHTDSTHGTLRAWVFDDAEFNADSERGYTGVNLTQKQDFRYFMPIVSHNDGTTPAIGLTIDDLFVGNSTDDVTYSQVTIYNGSSISIENVQQNPGICAKTAGGRWYAFLRYTIAANHYAWWKYSDDDGATWSGPYKLGGPGGWTQWGLSSTAMGSWAYDDVLCWFDYKENTTFSYAAVEGGTATGAFSPGSLDNGYSALSACSFANLVNIQQTDETFCFWPTHDGSGNFGWKVAYTDHEGDAGWTISSFQQEANSLGNSLDSSGGFRAIATRNGLWVHLLYRAFDGVGANYDDLRIRRYDVTNHTYGSSQTLVEDHGELAYQYIQATIDVDGYIHIVWGEGDVDEKVMYMRLSDDGDNTYTVEHGPSIVYTVNGENFIPNGIAVNEDGDIFVVVSRVDEDAIHMMRSQNNGETWGTIKRITGTVIGGQGPYQDPNRAHTYLDNGSPPFVWIDEGTDDVYWMTASDQGDYLTRWPDETAEDLGDWGRKVEIVVNKDYVGEDVHDFPVILDKDTFPWEMLDASGDYPCQEGGFDIRASLGESGEQRIPVDVRDVHIAADSGDAYANVCVKLDLTTGEDTSFWIWYNNPDANPVAKGEDYGGANVYTGDFEAVFPLHEVADGSLDFKDRTRNSRTLVSENMDSGNRVTGEISHGQTFDDIEETIALYLYGTYTNGWILFSYPYTVSFVGQRDPAGVATWGGFFQSRDDVWTHWLGVMVNSSGGARMTVDDGSADEVCNTTDVLSAGEKGWITGIAGGASTRYAQLNAHTRDTDGTSQNFPTSDPINNFLRLCDLFRSSTHNYYAGNMAELRISSVARTQGWVDTEYYNIFEPSNFFTPGTPEDGGPVADVLRRHMCNLMCS